MNRSIENHAVRALAASLSFIVLGSAVAAAQGGEKNPIEVSVVTDSAAFAPGKSVMVGALFDIAPGWHLYWKNPGESGLPTEVSFAAAPGVEVREALFPVPERFELPGGITGNGYEGSALVAAELAVPEGSGPAAKEVTATLKWLGCSAKLCVPGRATKKIEIGSAPASPERFASFRERFPIDAGSAGSPLEARLSGTLAAEPGSVSKLAIDLSWKERGLAGRHDLFIVPPKGYSLLSAGLSGPSGAPVAAGEAPVAGAVELRAESPRPGDEAALEFLLVRGEGAGNGIQGRFTLTLGEKHERKEVDR